MRSMGWKKQSVVCLALTIDGQVKFDTMVCPNLPFDLKNRECEKGWTKRFSNSNFKICQSSIYAALPTVIKDRVYYTKSITKIVKYSDIIQIIIDHILNKTWALYMLTPGVLWQCSGFSFGRKLKA
ncbi:8077_t:CDS:2 [Ambispora gerdemannii]|uniref:8077_t:CDS:1 n=1 Tax=Ambispora gerdemannii TaxID=144530 RepID=A0A9N8WJY8_9GLOM|nr:8077_t:CDS:2 [Ambispora gerdemannii]